MRFPYGRFILRLKREQVSELIEQLRRRRTPYRSARQKLGKVIAEALSQEYVRRLRRQFWSMRADELKDLMEGARKELATSGVLDAILPGLSPTGVVQQLLEDQGVLQRAGAMLTTKELELLARRPSRRARVTWSPSDLPLLDEAMACIRGPGTVFGHVVVDEAQDLSPMQWRVITRRTSRGSMTILGDLAQATSPWSPRTWTTVIRHAGLAGKAEVAQLRLGYRVPRQVMDFASPLLAKAAPAIDAPKSFRSGIDPVLHRSPEGSLLKLAREVATNSVDRGSVAVISPVTLRGRLVEAVGDVGTRISVLTPEEAKGLEFDVVVVVEPFDIAGRTQAGLRSLYICLTRATKELIVLHSKPLPIELRPNQPSALPATYPNPRNDDPWDNDVVHWLLEQAGGAKWTRGVLFECLRRQPNQTAKDPKRVRAAAQFARHHGVVQRRKPHGQGTIIRLMRTDPAAPQYPSTEAERRAWLAGGRRVDG